MSTNSLVAYMDKDWKVTSSYVHYDGHTTGVGEMLLENYNTEEKAKELATTLGYASSLSETVAKSHEDLHATPAKEKVWDDALEFEEYIRENPCLEYVYVWVESEEKWSVATWNSTKKKHLLGFTDKGPDYEFDYDWNGFEDLVPVAE